MGKKQQQDYQRRQWQTIQSERIKLKNETATITSNPLGRYGNMEERRRINEQTEWNGDDDDDDDDRKRDRKSKRSKTEDR